MVIGLEVHCELATETKLFCACPNHFGDEPNTNTCPTCLGLPGSLPVLNERAVELAMRLGRALQCDVNRSVFARKNYFYPDQPKDYQVSQYDLPTNEHGPPRPAVGPARRASRGPTSRRTPASSPTSVAAAASTTPATASSTTTAPACPLVEIVSEADMRTSDQAKEYVSELRAILLATGVSDAKMEEGSMRVDANVSVHRAGEPWGTRCEIKNLNSLRSLGRAIDHEALRQIDLLDGGRDRPPGDPPLGRGVRSHRHAPGEGGRRRLPLLPRARPRAARSHAREDIARIDAALPVLPARPSRRPGRPPPASSPPAARSPSPWSAASTTSPLAAIAAGADADRVLTHVEHNLAVDGAEALSRRAPRRARADGDRRASSPPPRPRPCSPRWSRPGQGPGRDRRGQGLRGAGHRRARGASSTR